MNDESENDVQSGSERRRTRSRTKGGPRPETPTAPPREAPAWRIPTDPPPV